MKRDSPIDSVQRESALATKILRNVIVQVQPHTLGRPGRPGSVVPTASLVTIADPYKESVNRDQLLLEAHEAAHASGYAAAVEIFEAKQRDEFRLIQAEAHETGYKEGYVKGMDVAQSESRAILQRSEAALEVEWRKKINQVEQMLHEGAAQITARVDEAEEEMIALVYEAVGAVLGEALATQQGIRAMVNRLVVRQRSRGQLAVHLHPDDWAVVSLNDDVKPATPEVRWVSDSKVALGGVVLHHAQGRLDAALDTVMRNLRVNLLHVRESRRNAASEVVVHSTTREVAE